MKNSFLFKLILIIVIVNVLLFGIIISCFYLYNVQEVETVEIITEFYTYNMI